MRTSLQIHTLGHTPRGYSLDTYTRYGYPSRMEKATSDVCLKRLTRIEGQVRGIARMVEEKRYCIDIITQISAVRAALRKVEEAVLEDHVGHCVAHAIASGNAAEQRRKVAELMEVLSRSVR
jgi:CsoR family transcriptional regulator, copper-sensing transcriptional repressor